jgi:hypothetical protein
MKVTYKFSYLANKIVLKLEIGCIKMQQFIWKENIKKYTQYDKRICIK